jgi:hypothetical protein
MTDDLSVLESASQLAQASYAKGVDMTLVLVILGLKIVVDAVSTPLFKFLTVRETLKDVPPPARSKVIDSAARLLKAWSCEG